MRVFERLRGRALDGSTIEPTVIEPAALRAVVTPVQTNAVERSEFPLSGEADCCSCSVDGKAGNSRAH